MCRSALGLGSSTVTRSQSTTMPASSGSAATWASISSLVSAAALAQSERVSPRLLFSTRSSAVYLAIRPLFAISRPLKYDDPKIASFPLHTPNERLLAGRRLDHGVPMGYGLSLKARGRTLKPEAAQPVGEISLQIRCRCTDG